MRERKTENEPLYAHPMALSLSPSLLRTPILLCCCERSPPPPPPPATMSAASLGLGWSLRAWRSRKEPIEEVRGQGEMSNQQEHRKGKAMQKRDSAESAKVNSLTRSVASSLSLCASLAYLSLTHTRAHTTT